MQTNNIVHMFNAHTSTNIVGHIPALQNRIRELQAQLPFLFRQFHCFSFAF